MLHHASFSIPISFSAKVKARTGRDSFFLTLGGGSPYQDFGKWRGMRRSEKEEMETDLTQSFRWRYRLSRDFRLKVARNFAEHNRSFVRAIVYETQIEKPRKKAFMIELISPEKQHLWAADETQKKWKESRGNESVQSREVGPRLSPLALPCPRYTSTLSLQQSHPSIENKVTGGFSSSWRISGIFLYILLLHYPVMHWAFMPLWQTTLAARIKKPWHGKGNLIYQPTRNLTQWNSEQQISESQLEWSGARETAILGVVIILQGRSFNDPSELLLFL